jgi:transposase
MPRISNKHERTMFQKKILKELEKVPNTKIDLGLDLHKSSIHAAIFIDGATLTDWRTTANYGDFADQILPFLPFTKTVAYEAGPTGFSLARILQGHGFNVVVCAPAHTPRPSARQNKSDRIDSIKLAQLSAAGMLKAVTIPTEQEEQDRLVLRHRNALVDKSRRVKQQIKAEFLFIGTGEVGSWGKKEIKRLAEFKCSENQRFTLDSMLRELGMLDDEVKVTTARVDLIMRERHADVKAILESHPGVGPITAATFALELFRSPQRFRNGRHVASFIGLAPGKDQTGESDRPQPLLKRGQARLRSHLIEAAWRWIRLDPKAREAFGRIACKKKGNGKKAIAAMARRLAVRLWTMWTRGEMYNPEKEIQRQHQRVARKAEATAS